MKKTIALILIALSVSARAQIYEAREVDLVERTAPDLDAFQANYKAYSWTVKNNDSVADITGATPFMYYYAKGETGIVSATCATLVATSGTFTATFDPSDLNPDFLGNVEQDVIYGVGITFTNGSTTVKQGQLTIIPDPFSAGVDATTFSSTVNWALYTWLNVPSETDSVFTNLYAQGLDLSTMTNAPSEWTAASDAGGWSGYAATQAVDMATFDINNAGDIEADSVKADTSAGMVIKNLGGSTVATFGAGAGTGVTMLGGLNVYGVITGNGSGITNITESDALFRAFTNNGGAVNGRLDVGSGTNGLTLQATMNANGESIINVAEINGVEPASWLTAESNYAAGDVLPAVDGGAITGMVLRTWAELGNPGANWGLDYNDGAEIIVRPTVNVTNVYDASAITTAQTYTVKFRYYVGTNSFAAGAATWKTSAPTATNDYFEGVADVTAQGVSLFLLGEGAE